MTKTAGLEGIVVADTAKSDVDGAAGQLIIGGYFVEQLAGQASFEDVLALLAEGELPDELGRERVRARLSEGRLRAHERLSRLGDALEQADPMSALMAALAHFPFEANAALDVAALASGALATFAAAWWRIRSGARPLAPDPATRHAADYLRLVRGAPAHDFEARALDAYMVTVSDHGLNASTFAARVVASTGSDPGSALVAAIAALKGPLHGGAPGPVLEMLEQIARPERARSFLEGELAQGRRIMGMGHRIYRTRDPRALVLETALSRLERELGETAEAASIARRVELARAVEREAEALLGARHPTRPLKANVEFYTAVLLDALGLPALLFSPTFAIARAAGWAAHIVEQREGGRLMRPASHYVGPLRSRSEPRAAR
jgi:citrate synthase